MINNNIRKHVTPADVDAALSRIPAIVRSVDIWLVPPELRGQHVKVRYGMSEDGVPLRWTEDEHGVSTYERAEGYVRDDWDPFNRAPTGYEWRSLSAGRTP